MSNHFFKNHWKSKVKTPEVEKGKESGSKKTQQAERSWAEN